MSLKSIAVSVLSAGAGWPFRWVWRRIMWSLPCRVTGHAWVHVNGARVGYCEKCRGWYTVGMGGKAVDKLDPKAAPRARRRNSAKGMELFGEAGLSKREAKMVRLVERKRRGREKGQAANAVAAQSAGRAAA